MISRKLRPGLCVSLVETNIQERWSIMKRSDRSQILRHGRQWKTWTRWLLLSLATLTFPAWAQTGATVSGVVTDQSGAPLPGVAVRIKKATS